MIVIEPQSSPTGDDTTIRFGNYLFLFENIYFKSFDRGISMNPVNAG